MSLDAITAVLNIELKPSSHKFVLFVMANFTNESGESYPSIPTIAQKTSLDHKTVRNALHALVEKGYLQDTGKRTGVTWQVPVYRLMIEYPPKNGTLPKTVPSQNSRERLPKTVPQRLPKLGGRYKRGYKRIQKINNVEHDASRILTHLNQASGHHYEQSKHILARLREGATIDDALLVIDWYAAVRLEEWDEAAKYFRPSTLFNAEKFDDYRSKALQWKAGTPPRQHTPQLAY